MRAEARVGTLRPPTSSAGATRSVTTGGSSKAIALGSTRCRRMRATGARHLEDALPP